MAELKHVGRMKNTGRKCLVVFRTLPGDAFSCLIIPTESLPDSYHDSLISLVESNAAQSTNEFSEVLARAVFSDGSTMLPTLHVKGFLSKVATDEVEMTPNNQASVLLSDLNQLIAEQQGVSVQDLAIKPAQPDPNVEVKEVASAKDISPKTGNTDPLMDQVEDFGRTTSASVNQEAPITKFDSPETEAKYYRSQADRLAKQAAEMRRKAEELAPTKKKTANVL
jgi:hypothetical protein